MIDVTLQSLKTQKSKVDTVQAQIVTLSDHFAADHDKLVNGRDSAANALSLARNERLLSSRTRFSSFRLNLPMHVKRSPYPESVLVSLSFLRVRICTRGRDRHEAGTALIVAGAVGVIGVRTAATFTGIFTAKIGKLLEEIAERQSALEDKKKQVTALEGGLVNTMTTLKTHNEAAKTALTQVSTMWKTLGEKLSRSVRNWMRRRS